MTWDVVEYVRKTYELLSTMTMKDALGAIRIEKYGNTKVPKYILMWRGAELMSALNFNQKLQMKRAGLGNLTYHPRRGN